MRKILLILTLSIISCNDKGSILKKSKDAISSSANYLDSTLIKKPIKYFDDRKLKSDSLEQKKIKDYYDLNKAKYPEYSLVYNWFNSKPKQIQNLEGNFYKIISSVVIDGKDVVRKNHENSSGNNVYKYFFETENYFFIYELRINGKNVQCLGVRRIEDGLGNEPMYDLIFDENGNLKKEIYQAEVNPNFYEDEDTIFFEFSKEYDDKEIINTINLGKAI